jgi:hypothetical protein
MTKDALARLADLHALCKLVRYGWKGRAGYANGGRDCCVGVRYCVEQEEEIGVWCGAWCLDSLPDSLMHVISTSGVVVAGVHVSLMESPRRTGPKLLVAANGGLEAPGGGKSHVWGSGVAVDMMEDPKLGESQKIYD